MGAWSEMNQRKRLMANWISRVPPLTITLIRPTWQTTDAGGRVQTGTTTLDPQDFGFMPFKRRLTIELAQEPYNYGQNKIDDIYYVLIGIPGIHNIAKDDYFIWGITEGLEPGRYDVDFVQARRHDHLQAGIRYRGPDES